MTNRIFWIFLWIFVEFCELHSIEENCRSAIFCQRDSKAICIERSSVCDGLVDCDNEIDEICAQNNPLIVCSNEEFLCPISHRCIPKAWLCNGINDCRNPFASDELNCSKAEFCSDDEFSCRTTDQCIPLGAKCDGISDCSDESDESPAVCHSDAIGSCSDDQFSCRSTKLCIQRSKRCDTISQCHDQSDEFSCRCPIDDHLSKRLFYPCQLTNECLPKNVPCHVKEVCRNDLLDQDFQCSEENSRPCSSNVTCDDRFQYCDQAETTRCRCHDGFRFDQSSGKCQDIDECRERPVCDQFCLNTIGSYRCACKENFHLQSDKHTCFPRHRSNRTVSLVALLENEIHRYFVSDDGKILSGSTLLFVNGSFSVDYDPIDDFLYFAQCSNGVRLSDSRCSSKVNGIFRIRLTDRTVEKQLIVSSRDFPSIDAFQIDWRHQNIYLFVRFTRKFFVCRLNGSFCRTFFQHQPIDEQIQSFVLHPEKGFLFYIVVDSRKELKIMKLSFDGHFCRTIFTSNQIDENEDFSSQAILNFDRTNDQLYFYNGFDRIWILNLNGGILHVQHQSIDRRMTKFSIFSDKIFKIFPRKNEIRINGKFSVFDEFNETSHFDHFHSLYNDRYEMKIFDLLFIDFKDHRISDSRCDRCEQLCFPNSFDQTEIICSCADFNEISDGNGTCRVLCPENFFTCSSSKRCLPFYQRCDGFVDCSSGEDEADCQENPCASISKISCSKSNQCIPIDEICNDKTDCLYGEDEDAKFCSSLRSVAFSNETIAQENSSTSIDCDSMNLFRCRTVPHCVNQSYVCDGHDDCTDGSDEEICHDEFPTISKDPDPSCMFGYRCHDDHRSRGNVFPPCISLNKLCDGVYHCPMEDDEHQRHCETQNFPDEKDFSMKKSSKSKTARTNETFETIFHSGASFYVNRSGSIMMPIDSKHRVIDVVFLPTNSSWIIFYIEQSSNSSKIFSLNFDPNSKKKTLPNEIWSSSVVVAKLLEVDWIHRLLYVVYNDRFSSLNGIEILHSASSDYKTFVSINDLTFSNRKTISSINVDPFSGFLYLSGFYDARNSFVYRTFLDGTELNVFLTTKNPVVKMSIDYRSSTLFAVLSNGFLESYALNKTPAETKVLYKFHEIYPYWIDADAESLTLMIYNETDFSFKRIFLDHFGDLIEEENFHFKTKIVVRSIDSFRFPTLDDSECLKNQICQPNEICIKKPNDSFSCVSENRSEFCRSACHHRGICATNRCICSNETFTGNDCSMCRINDRFSVGCFQDEEKLRRKCLCLLTRSVLRNTPYRCLTLDPLLGDSEVPCDRIVSPIDERQCSKDLFQEPTCDGIRYSLIFHRSTQTCLCRESKQPRTLCLDQDLLIFDQWKNSTFCSCSPKSTRPFCQRQTQFYRRFIALLVIISMVTLTFVCFLRGKTFKNSIFSFTRTNRIRRSWDHLPVSFENDLFLLDMHDSMDDLNITNDSQQTEMKLLHDRNRAVNDIDQL